MDIALDFTTTATNRPEILDSTYASFTSKLKGVDFSASTLYINVDPAPNADNREAVMDVAKKYFTNIVYRLPENPSFPEAVKWCFSNTKREFVFLLEDDWNLLENVQLNSIIEMFNSGKNIGQIRLRKHNGCGESKKKLMLALCPSLIRGDLCRSLSQLISGRRDPEIDIRQVYSTSVYRHLRCKTYQYPTCQSPRKIIVDIGRQWSRSHRVKKPDKNKFITWVGF